ncbi:MAG: amidohydrolase family protein [Gemmatimonadota bacterium]|nr:amidohydrolase family protein [Gemmatimonadota bacterium]
MNTSRNLVCLALGFLLMEGCGSDAGEPVADLVIRNVTLLSPRDGSVQHDRSVFISGERIVDIRRSTDGAPPSAARVVEATGRFLMPGMWDLHTHFSFADPSAGPLLVTQGVTGARDMGSVLDEVEAARRRFDRGEALGPRILRAGPTLNGGVFGDHHRLIGDPDAARAAVALLDSIGVDVIKTHNETGRETYFALLEAAEAAGLQVVGHVPVTVSPLEACERGQGSIDHIVTIFEGVYGAGFDSQIEAFRGMEPWLETEAPALVECFSRQGTLFVPTLYTYHFRAHRAELYETPPDGWDYLSASGRLAYREELVPSESDRDPDVIRLRVGLVEIGKALTRIAYEAGARIGTGTDFAGPGLVPGFSLRREVELLAEAGLPLHAALWAATSGPGVEQGADPLTGDIGVGAPADLVLLEANPFEDLGALSEIVGVGLRGRWLDRAELDRVLEGLAAN